VIGLGSLLGAFNPSCPPYLRLCFAHQFDAFAKGAWDDVPYISLQTSEVHVMTRSVVKLVTDFAEFQPHSSFLLHLHRATERTATR
jgi:hypothetical protein